MTTEIIFPTVNKSIYITNDAIILEVTENELIFRKRTNRILKAYNSINIIGEFTVNCRKSKKNTACYDDITIIDFIESNVLSEISRMVVDYNLSKITLGIDKEGNFYLTDRE